MQNSPKLLRKLNACALHFRELKKTHIDRTRCSSAVCWKFGINVMQKSSRLKLFYQIDKIDKFLKYARRSRASKALPLDDLSEAVSAYNQVQEVVWHPRCSGEFLIHCGLYICKLARNDLKSSCLHVGKFISGWCVEDDGDVLNTKPRDYLSKFSYQVR